MTDTEKRSSSKRGTIINGAMLMIFFLSLLFIFIIWLTGNQNSTEPLTEDLSWNEGWILEDGSELSLPCADKLHDSLTIKKTLPAELTKRDSLVFSSGYQPIRVTVDGEEVPVIGSFEGRIVYATAYNHISLSPEMSEKEIEVTFLNRGGKQWIEIYSIKLGDFNLIRQSAFEKDRVSVISATLLLVFSLLAFIVCLFQRRSPIQGMNDHSRNFLLASIVAIMLSTWMLVDTETVTLLFGDSPAYVFINIFSFLFIMGPWLMQVILTANRHAILLRVLAMSGLIEIAVIMLGVIFGFFHFSAYLTFSHLIGIGVEASILYLSFDTFRKRRDAGSTFLFAAGILLVVMSSIAAYVYYFKVSPNNVSYMKYGILAYLLAMLCDLVLTFRHINQRYVSEIEAARLAAEEANRAKSDFLSGMSHDIRTPMNAIMGLTTIASANIDNKDIVRDALRKVSLSSRHLLGLINDILDMSKIESGKISLTVSEISLPELLENLLNIVQPQIKSRRQTFDIFLQSISAEHVYCDGVRLNQILLNLVSNAVKYTKDEGSISFTLTQESSPKGEKWVRTSFRVTDTGIGMTPEFLQRIFDSFTRADNYDVNAIEGSGLGMSITKHIVDMMGGEISVESRLGEGSSFLVTLDLERVTPEEQNRILPPWNTLVVDDDEPLCRSAVATLQEMGIRADWTQSGKEAVALVTKASRGLNPYHVVLLDWKMPELDGIETARRIRAEVGEEVPILLITAYDWSEIEEEARAAGINGFLSKPLFRSTLRCGLMQYVAHEGQPAPEEREETIDFTGRRILLSEDNDLNWEIAHHILSESGFRVDRAEDGLRCLECFEASEHGYYDIILMDIRMPRMDGYQSTAAIRALHRPDAASIPILAMTADAFNEDIQHCLDVGMNGHISKPIDMKALFKLIGSHLK